MASGGRHGLAQSLFQVGGNFGQSLGPLLAAFIVLPHGQRSVAWFALGGLLAIMVLLQRRPLVQGSSHAPSRAQTAGASPTSRRCRAAQVRSAHRRLVALIFSKYFYLASITQLLHLLSDRQLRPVGAERAGPSVRLPRRRRPPARSIGGPIGDRFGRKSVIWGSILGVLPFTLALPYADLFWTDGLTVIIGLSCPRPSPAIVVYAQELMPGPGRHGLGPVLRLRLRHGRHRRGGAGLLADRTSIEFVYQVCAFLPLGLLAAFLPDIERRRQKG